MNMNARPVIAFFILFLALGCDSIDNGMISLDGGKEFSFNLNVSGDEEGARIIQQAKHYLRSEIVRDSSTEWRAVYFYVPAMDYSGVDYVEIETCNGGKGILCDEISIIEFEFNVHE
jgi:hypothetical protein